MKTIEQHVALGCVGIIAFIILLSFINAAVCVILAALIHWAIPSVSFPLAFVVIFVGSWIIGLIGRTFSGK